MSSTTPTHENVSPTITEHTAYTVYGEPYTFYRCGRCGDESVDRTLLCESCER